MGSIQGFGVLITGGGTGIGLGAAKLLAEQGAAVTICGRTAATLEKAAAEIGHGAKHLVADVTNEAEISAAIDAAAAVTGRLDAVFANAGGSRHMGPLGAADVDAFRATVDLNVTGTFLTIKHAARVMSTQSPSGGAIVTMSSGAGAFPHRFLPAYGASKAGIDMLTRYAAEEWGAKGIRVNSVQPGIVHNDVMAGITAGGKLMDDYHEQMPLYRPGTVDDIGEAVRFLIGPESSWITGINLNIDGGHHLRRGANYELLLS